MNLALSHLTLPLAHFTLEIDATLTQRVTAIFGPSGSGKTSLLELIAGLRRPATGTLSLDGRTLSDATTRHFAPPQNRAIGYVPQDGALFPHLSVRANLLYGLKSAHTSAPAWTLEHVVDVLEIAPLLDRSPRALSGGEKQRVSLGRALLASPRLLLLDEPLASLDRPLKQRLLAHLARIRDEFSVPMIYVSHAEEEVRSLCDEVLLISQGRIAQRGAPSQVFTNVT